jgi:hypothetical protein
MKRRSTVQLSSDGGPNDDLLGKVFFISCRVYRRQMMDAIASYLLLKCLFGGHSGPPIPLKVACIFDGVVWTVKFNSITIFCRAFEPIGYSEKPCLGWGYQNAHPFYVLVPASQLRLLQKK